MGKQRVTNKVAKVGKVGGKGERGGEGEMKGEKGERETNVCGLVNHIVDEGVSLRNALVYFLFFSWGKSDNAKHLMN